MQPKMEFWQGKRVLLTGHTGFKGGWLAIWLHHLGALVTGVALPPTTEPNLFHAAQIAELVTSHCIDIRNESALQKAVESASPEIVFHLAAQPLVIYSYQNPRETHAINIMGTVNLLDALRRIDSLKVAIIITTDKVYHNQEWPYPYRENDPLGGHDPYSASKAAAEIVTASYREAFFAPQDIAVATARAGNVIGGGDWSENRIIPDAIRAWQNANVLSVRRPDAIRPWQHVLEPLVGYLVLAERLWLEPALAGPYNFGPDTHSTATVRKIIEMASSAFGNGLVVWADGNKGPHEAGTLALENALSRTILGISPQWVLAESITRTIHWYRGFLAGRPARDLCLADIESYRCEL